MQINHAVKNRILHLCRERELSINKLAYLSGVPRSSLKNIIYGKSRNPQLLIIKLVCNGLNISLSEFFNTPEFDNLDQEF